MQKQNKTKPVSKLWSIHLKRTIIINWRGSQNQLVEQLTRELTEQTHTLPRTWPCKTQRCSSYTAALGGLLSGGDGGMETLVIVSEGSPKPSCERDPCAESRGRTRGQDAPSVLGPCSARGGAVGSPQGLPGPASDRFTFGKNSWKFGG